MLTMIDMHSSYSSQDSTVLRCFVDKLFELCVQTVGLRPSELLSGKTKIREETISAEITVDRYSRFMNLGMAAAMSGLN